MVSLRQEQNPIMKFAVPFLKMFALCMLWRARIFMKFKTYAHKIVVYHQPNFHKDPCKDARARGVNARARISSRWDSAPDASLPYIE